MTSRFASGIATAPMSADFMTAFWEGHGLAMRAIVAGDSGRKTRTFDLAWRVQLSQRPERLMTTGYLMQSKLSWLKNDLFDERVGLP
jgi:hypothetical protein